MEKSVMKKAKCMGLLKPILCIVLVIMLGFTMKTIASATETLQNTYALRVSTGLADGSCIGFFGIEYKAEDGNTYTHYVFPHDGDYAKGYESIVEDGAFLEQIRRERAVNMGYYFDEWNNMDAKVVMGAYTEDMFFFQIPERAISSIENIYIYTDLAEASSKTWTCTGLEVYQIEKINGRKMYGYISGEQYLSFSGKVMASLVRDSIDFGSATDTVFRLSPNVKDYTLDTTIKDYKDTSASGDAEYIFKISLADVYGAGIETFVNYEGNLIRDLTFPEVLNLEVVYECTTGRNQIVNVPVITSALINAMGNVGIDTKLVDFAGQGESIAVPANLPYFKELISVKLTYGVDVAMEASGIKESDVTAKRKNQKEAIVNNEDLISVSSIAMYKSGRDASILTYEVQDGTILLSNVTGNPVYYYTANSYRGTEIGMNSTVTFAMQSYEEGVSLEPRDNQTKYLIVIDTDTSGTLMSQKLMPNIEMSLTYTSTTGASMETERYSLKELAKDYYGYTPTNTGEDCAYAMNVSKGQRLFVLVSLSGVEKFTSVSLNLFNASEEWQMSNFAIYRVTELSNRHAQWLEKEADVYGQKAKFSYYREINGTEEIIPKSAEIYNAGITVLFQNNVKQTIDFSSLNVTETERQFDWMAIDKYLLEYKKADANYLGFYNASEDYQIDVKVADNTRNSLDDGDSGSKNYFYFQLVFQDGTSAVVQANQLLQADGFLTGQVATFNISTNYDYGDLVAVRIIPDDFTANSDPYDKLNVEYINITKKSKSGYSTVWRVGEVGWIGIDYKDDGKTDKSQKETGRTLEELSYTYKVTGASTGVEIEFAITTGIFPEESGGKPFIGSVMADIGYIDGHGGYKRVSLDVVQAMYNYANKTPRENAGNGKAQSDPEFMFLENRTNRFTHFLSDVSELVDIRLYVYSDGGGVLNISNISASLVVQDGVLGINNWGEYEKRSTLFPLTQNDGPISIFELGKLGNTNAMIAFHAMEEGMLKGVVNGTWPYDVKQETVNGEEYLNIRVYPSEKLRDVPELVMQVVVDYSDSYGRTYRVQNPLTLKTATNGDFYYVVEGVRASDISAIKQIRIERVSGSGDMAIGEVIVQKIREDRIVETSLYHMNGVKASVSATADTTQNMAETGEVQKVWISFTDEMKGVDLASQLKDVAVALRYTSSYDPNGKEYISSYVYLTESQISSITGGQIGEFVFHIKNVNKITGIVVAATGGLTIETEHAIVTTYQTTADTMKLKDWYSVSEGSRIENASKTFAVSTNEVNSVNTVVPVTMELTTGVVNGQNTGTDAAIRMVMQYIGFDGLSHTLEIEDIRKYTISGNYNTGETAKVSLLLSNVKEISFLTFEPYDQDQNVMESWKLANIMLSYGTELSKKTASITMAENNAMAYEGMPIRVVFKKIILQLNQRVGTTNVVITEDKKDYGTVIFTNEEMYISSVTMNSGLGCDIFVYELVDGNRRDVTAMYLSEELENGEYLFKVPSTGANTVFEIEAVSKELSEFKLSYKVSVMAAPEVSDDTESNTEASKETEQ